MSLSPRQMLDLPPVWLMGMLAMTWLLARVLEWGPVLDLPGQRLVGAVLVLVGMVLTAFAVAAFRRHDTSIVPHQVPTRMITTGIFARTRNPIYLADVAILLGVVFWLGSVLSLLLVPLFVWILKIRFIGPEEARLADEFGQEFTRYAEKTPRWF